MAAKKAAAKDEAVEETKADAPAGPADAAASTGTTASPEEIASGVSNDVAPEDDERVDVSTDESGNEIDPDAKPEEPVAAEPVEAAEVDEDGWTDEERAIIKENEKAFEKQKKEAEARREDDPNNHVETEEEYGARIEGAKTWYFSA